jgi:membrane-associated phospholipid phosphatase
MADSAELLLLLRRTLLTLGIGALAVVLCYYWVDRPVALFVHKQAVARIPGMVWLTYPPPVIQSWSPLLLAMMIVSRAWGPWRKWQLTLLVAGISLIVADQFRESLGDLCGRYWPETWHDNNPSLIGNGTYGFHPFHAGDDTGSFPSGHAARILGFVAVLWIGAPSGRLIYAIVSLPMLIALVAMNFHFVSDVIAGSVLGGIVGAYAAMLSGLSSDEHVTVP